MNASSLSRPGTPRIAALILSIIDWANRFPSAILGLIIRVGIADVFWRSGQSKVHGWNVTGSAIQLFREEYKLPLLSLPISPHCRNIYSRFYWSLAWPRACPRWVFCS
jgi:putative oxidoreductase